MNFSTIDIKGAEEDIALLMEKFDGFIIETTHSEPQEDGTWKRFNEKFTINDHHYGIKSILNTLNFWKEDALVTLTVTKIYMKWS